MKLRRTQPSVLFLIFSLFLSLSTLEARAQAEPAPVNNPAVQNPDIVVPPSPTRRTRDDQREPVLVDPRPAPAHTPAISNVVLPEGTPIPVRPTRHLSSTTHRSGDRFEAILDEDLIDTAGNVLLPKGALFKGHLEDVLRGGKVSGRAEMTLVLDSLELGGLSYPIQTEPIQVRARGSKGRDARNIGIAAGIGAAIGAIFGGAKGAAVGATIGGGASTARVMTSRGQDAEIEKEQLVTFSLARQLDLRERAPSQRP